VTIHVKATETYFSVLLFISLYEVVLTFESVAETLKCGHSYESYWAVLSCGTVCYAVYYFTKLVILVGTFLKISNLYRLGL